MRSCPGPERSGPALRWPMLALRRSPCFRACRQAGEGATMDLDGDYDPDNIFAKIVRGDMPAARVFEDHDVLAFMDVFPQGRGHTLVVHKRAHARNLLDVEPEPLQTLILGVQRVTR